MDCQGQSSVPQQQPTAFSDSLQSERTTPSRVLYCSSRTSKCCTVEGQHQRDLLLLLLAFHTASKGSRKFPKKYFFFILISSFLRLSFVCKFIHTSLILFPLVFISHQKVSLRLPYFWSQKIFSLSAAKVFFVEFTSQACGFLASIIISSSPGWSVHSQK